MSRPLNGYPTSWGNHRASIFPTAGPSSYTRVTSTAGTIPATGGDSVAATEAGLKYFDLIVGGITDDGAFTVVPIPLQSSKGVSSSAATYKLKWIANVTAVVGGQNQTAGTEAAASTDLSGEVIRLLGIGPK